MIAEPFSEWWNTSGEAFLGDVAGKIGSGLGKFYKGSILTLLGIDAEGAAEGGLSIGAKFAEGFLDGFDAENGAAMNLFAGISPELVILQYETGEVMYEKLFQ